MKITSSSIGIFAALFPSVLAACDTTGQYNKIPGYVEPNACVASGYFQAQDLGNTNPTDLVSRCEAQCTSYGSRCEAYVGQLQKAADSNLYSGQCFYYSSTPPPPVNCANYPTIILAEQKDHSLQCFSSSAAVASAYCSSYLSIGTQTSYSTTVTPQATSTSKTTTVTTTTTPTTTTTTIVVTGTSTLTSTITVATTSPFTTITTTMVVSTTTTYTSTLSGAPLRRRAANTSPAPACLATTLPASRISSACSCLSIRSTTATLASTAATTTSSTTATITNTNTAVSTVLSTATSSTTIITTTSTSVASTITSFATSVSTTSTVLTVSGVTSTCAQSGGHCTDYSNCCGGVCAIVINYQTVNTCYS